MPKIGAILHDALDNGLSKSGAVQADVEIARFRSGNLLNIENIHVA